MAVDYFLKVKGIEGHYDAKRGMYLPPRGYRNWRECVVRNRLDLEPGEPFVGP